MGENLPIGTVVRISAIWLGSGKFVLLLFKVAKFSFCLLFFLFYGILSVVWNHFPSLLIGGKTGK